MNSSSKLTKEKVIRFWTIRGIEDFYLGFYIEGKFRWYPPLFYAQGLEKILKAYILGTRAEEYEYLSENEAREKINEIAKSRELGHNLKKMIEKLISKNILSRNVFTDLFTKCGEKK